MEFLDVKYPQTQFLEKFLSTAGKSLETFRYFSKRPLNAIEKHLCTYLLKEGEEVLAYGHLDKEEETVWLGIAVAEYATGKGLGKMMMHQLLDFAKKNHVPQIKLSVDNDNLTAINLYVSMGFSLLEKKEKFSFYTLKNL